MFMRSKYLLLLIAVSTASVAQSGLAHIFPSGLGLGLILKFIGILVLPFAVIYILFF